jgi:hypothetical protein
MSPSSSNKQPSIWTLADNVEVIPSDDFSSSSSSSDYEPRPPRRTLPNDVSEFPLSSSPDEQPRRTLPGNNVEEIASELFWSSSSDDMSYDEQQPHRRRNFLTSLEFLKVYEFRLL